MSRQSTKHQAKPEPCPVTTSTQGQMPGLAGPAVAGQGHAQGQMSAPSGEQKGSVGTSATRGNSKAVPASSYENECMYRSHVYVSGSGKAFSSYLTPCLHPTMGNGLVFIVTSDHLFEFYVCLSL